MVVAGHHYSDYTGFTHEIITAATGGFTEHLGRVTRSGVMTASPGSARVSVREEPAS